MRILLLFLLFASQVSSASGISVSSISDTTVNPAKKEHKISQEKFIDKFRDNSKAVSIINYFFKRKNRAGWIPILISVPIAIGAAILAVFTLESLIIIFLLLLIAGGIVHSTIGLVYLLVFSRKRLWRILTQYSANGKLPKNLKRKLRL